jgi:hypothetical protein
MTMIMRRSVRLEIRQAPYATRQFGEQRIGRVLDRARDAGLGRAAIRRVVLVAAILGRIMRRGKDDPVGKAAGPAPVVGEDRVRDDRGRRGAVIGIDEDVDAIRGEHRERGRERGPRQGVRVDAGEQRSVDAFRMPVLADGLADSQDMRFVEATVEG